MAPRKKKPVEMKKAKVSKGLVHHVWPHEKTLPDGTKVIKKLPLGYWGLAGKSIPDCIVDVPMDVQPGWRWDGEKYAPVVKKPIPVTRSTLLEVVSEKLGVSYEDLWGEILARKKARKLGPPKTP